MIDDSHAGEPKDNAGGFETSVAGHIVKVAAWGLWSVSEIDAHFASLQAILKDTRTIHANVLVLVDLRNATAQTAAVTERLSWWTNRLYAPQDRVAIVLASSLLKSQMRRIDIPATRELFLSSAAAMTWLTANAHNPVVAQAA
jgi:hypothetical protein